MLNYISAELYRTKNRLYSKMFIIACSALVVLGSLALLYLQGFGKSPLHMDEAITSMVAQFQMVYLFTLIAVDVVFTEEYKHHTFKNVVDSGISRKSIYLGKLLSEIIFSVIAYIIIMAVLIISSYIILGSDHVATISSLKTLAVGTLAAFPLWIAGMSIANTLSFIFKSNTLMAFTFAFILYGTRGIVMILGLFFEPVAYLLPFLPSSLLKIIATGTTLAGGFIGECYIVGIIMTVALALIGIKIFERKEIK